MENMLLAINIGNTNISCGIFSGRRMRARFDMPPARAKTTLAKKLRNYRSAIGSTVICSVVPAQTRIISSCLKQLTGQKPLVIGKDVIVPMRNLYHDPGKLGQDRLVNSYAASLLYKPPLVVIDAGTAITFDAVSASRAYLGGIIFPGLRISLKALEEKTALLPEIKISPPRGLIGRNTKSSMLSGVIFGTAELCRGMSERITRRLGGKASVIGTGGDMRLIARYVKTPMSIDKNLTLKGVYYTYIYGKKRHN
jgi:type III pantothenate kinase